MGRKNRRPLSERVVGAAETPLAAHGHVSPIDVLGGIGWLYADAVPQWQQGRIEYLEDALQVDPERLSQAMQLLQAWAEAKGLRQSEMENAARTPQRQILSFSRSGDPAVERLYRTHWLAPELSEAQRERLVERASRPPELVVIDPRNREWKCHRCGGNSGLLTMEAPGPCCLGCAGLDDLEFLPSGDALLTRRAKAKSRRHAVVVRFSRTRRRYERQGTLLEPPAIAAAQREVEERRDGQVGKSAPRRDPHPSERKS
jgi:hypothetical protein